eukprot:SAG31_NODE_624_length_13465_cov_11.802708_1_plen_337_part_00
MLQYKFGRLCDSPNFRFLHAQENVQKFSALTHQEKFEKVEQYLCHKHLGFSFSKFEKQSADWLQHTGEDGTIKQKSEYHSCGNCCRALFYEFPWISIITYCVLIAGLVMASTGLDPTVTTLLEVGLEDTSLITALFVTAGVVMLVVDAMAITTSVMCLGMVREVMWGKWGCCKPGYGDHHIQNGVYIEYVMAFLAFGSIVVMNFAVVTVSVAFVMVMMFTGVCDESDGTTRRQAAMATVMSLSPIEFISDDDTGGESYDRWMTGIADYCELTYETCMEDCNAGIIENDGDARWSAETCKCVYDRTDRQEQHSSYLLIGCAMMVRIFSSTSSITHHS